MGVKDSYMTHEKFGKIHAENRGFRLIYFIRGITLLL